LQSVIVQGFAGTPVGEKLRPLRLGKADVQGAIRLACDSCHSPSFFADAPPGIAFKNTFVEVTAEGILQREHSPTNRTRFAYQFDFAPGAAPERFLRFLAEVFRDDSDADEKIKLLQEYIGGSLLGLATRYQRALVLIGRGSNGKGVFTETVERAFPRESLCAIAPQAWDNEYRRAMLAGKRLNLVSELPEAEILASETFKGVISGDSMDGRHIRQAPFTFKPMAGHVFSANGLPSVRDQSHGFWRRPVIVEFNRVLEQHEQDACLKDKLAGEISGIVSWFLEGARRLLHQGDYTIPRSHDDALSKWRKNADQIRAFAIECTSPVPLGMEPVCWPRADAVYTKYRSWAERNGHRPVASNTFGERMRNIGLGSQHTDRGNVYPVVFGD
jgi:P4 family phage/plasmid primase-like protien